MVSNKPTLLNVLHKALENWVKQPNSNFALYLWYHQTRDNFFEQPPSVTEYRVDIHAEKCSECSSLYWWGFVDGVVVHSQYKCHTCFFRETWTELFTWVLTRDAITERDLQFKESIRYEDFAPQIPLDFISFIT